MEAQASSYVLVVDDEPIVAEIAAEALRDGGFSVIEVYDADSALREIESRPEAVVALVTDIRLPGEHDGWVIAKRGRELNPAIPVVYMSGDSCIDWSSKGVQGSVMLQKPFAASQLMVAVATLLNDSQVLGRCNIA